MVRFFIALMLTCFASTASHALMLTDNRYIRYDLDGEVWLICGDKEGFLVVKPDGSRERKSSILNRVNYVAEYRLYSARITMFRSLQSKTCEDIFKRVKLPKDAKFYK